MTQTHPSEPRQPNRDFAPTTDPRITDETLSPDSFCKFGLTNNLKLPMTGISCRCGVL